MNVLVNPGSGYIDWEPTYRTWAVKNARRLRREAGRERWREIRISRRVVMQNDRRWRFYFHRGWRRIWVNVPGVAPEHLDLVPGRWPVRCYVGPDGDSWYFEFAVKIVRKELGL